MEQKGAMNMTKTRKNTRDDKNSNIKSAEEISLFEKSKYGLDLVNGWISSADSKLEHLERYMQLSLQFLYI